MTLDVGEHGEFLLGGFKFQIFSIFTPKLGEMIEFDEHIFQMGGKKPTMG